MRTYIPILFALFSISNCTQVKVYQKERLADRIMIFDYNEADAILQSDIYGAREGAIGGSSAMAGGCSCK